MEHTDRLTYAFHKRLLVKVSTESSNRDRKFCVIYSYRIINNRVCQSIKIEEKTDTVTDKTRNLKAKLYQN